MDLYTGTTHVCFTFLLFMSAVWTFFAWGFGLLASKKHWSVAWGQVGDLCWYALFVMHGVLFYVLWFETVPVSSLLLLLIGLHVAFRLLFIKHDNQDAA